MPTVSIGMPVYNGEEFLRNAIDALLSQYFTDFELIISDNASSDQTESICRAYAERDKRIRYFRQPVNLGAEANFSYVLDRAKGEYFMWAASDDVRSADYVALNLDFLESHPDYVGSTSPVRFEGGGFDAQQMGDRGLVDDQFDLRLRKFFGAWHANGAFYSLMRTEVIKRCQWVGVSFLGADWAIVLYLARQGKLNRLEQGWLELGINGVSNSRGIFRRYRSNLLDFVAPFWMLTRAALSISAGAAYSSRLAIFWACLVMNVRALRVQILGRLYRVYKAVLS
jgi:glycosyltransferase involved in cell wall biosynthesis